MNGRGRVLYSLSHKEPDHVPLDIGGSDVTGIHLGAYRELALHQGFRPDVPICEIVQQVALPAESLLQELEVDVRPVFPEPPNAWKLEFMVEGPYRTFVDEFGVKWAMPLDGGLYYDLVSHPLSNLSGIADLAQHPWPHGADPGRIRGLRDRATELSNKTGAALVMLPLYGGIFESAFWLRGYKQFFLDLAETPVMVEAILDRTLQFRLDYWTQILGEVGDLIDIVVEYDDLGSMSGLLISPSMYRRYVKPRHRQLFEFIKSRTRAKIFFHCCGAIYKLIPDLIEAGIDILNPVQVSAAGMEDTQKLKQEFGRDLTFWGGGINTQMTLPHGTIQEVKEEVKRRIADLAPGGGYVFAAVHNIQADVPPENIMAMWEAWKEYGVY